MTEPLPAARDMQDALYTQATAEFGSALVRLAAATERDPTAQRDLLQEIHVALWRSFAVYQKQCSLRTWVYPVAHNAAATLERLYALIRQLKPIDRDVMLLYLEGVDGEGIADVLGISVTNVAQKIHRSKKLLQQRFHK